jgi:hypothetical protein
MDKKITKTKHASYKQYLVKWKGKPQEKRKWISEPDLKKLRGEKYLISNLNEDAQHSSNRGWRATDEPFDFDKEFMDWTLGYS